MLLPRHPWYPGLAVFMLASLAAQTADSQTVAKRLAVLEFKGRGIEGDVLDAFSDEVRGGAVEGLAGRGVQVMTRENMMVLLKEMGKSGCSEGDCEVETARNIGADFVVSASVVHVETMVVVTLKLHETKGGSLLATERVDGKSQYDILQQLRDRGRKVVASNIGARPAPSPPPVEGYARPTSASDVENRPATPKPEPAPVVPARPAAALGAPAGQMPGSAPTLIATVNMRRLYLESPEGQALQAKLQVEFSEKKRHLDEQQRDVKKRIEAFNRSRGTLSPEAIAKGEASLKQEDSSIQKLYETYQKERADRESELVSKLIGETIVPRLGTFTRASGAPTLLTSDSVLFARRELDLTEAVLAGAASASLKPIRIARIYLRKAVNSVHEGVRARAPLKHDFQEKQVELERISDEIKRDQEKFKRESTTMSVEARRNIEEQLRQRVVAVQKLYKSFQETLASREEAATAPVIDKITKLVARLANDRNLGLVYLADEGMMSGILGKKPDSLQPRPVDLTDEVIAAYDSQFP